MTLAVQMQGVAAAVEDELGRLLDLPEAHNQRRLADAMRYAALDGGKRLRPFLVRATAALGDVPEAAWVRVAASLELVHCYSLVHDDLPAMDDAATRRGRPSCHAAFDEATAVLAGDALLTLAFEALARDDWPADAVTRCALVAGLARAAGVEGMCGGQQIDLEAEGKPLGEGAITELQALKTGAIFAFACEAGARLAGLNDEQRQAVAAYARRFGLIFQITDDLLDATSTSGAIGKPAGADAARGKATFVALLGVEGARERVARLHAEALDALDKAGPGANLLRDLLCHVVDRRV
ncbi:farnesyl diphosphate synthase [Geminicoccaceae bacterium 1502E]|nr:farnesyl diphosphate synthase [Geminicoccaceae bacterium 1502E]